MLDIKKLEDDIYEQARNGRNVIYVDVAILNELGITYTNSGLDKVYIDRTKLENMIKLYKTDNHIEDKSKTFRNSLKVNVSNANRTSQLPTKNNTTIDIDR